MVDKDKAVLVGQADNIILEVAFLMDKLCSDDTMGSKSSYSDTHGIILREVKKLQIERDNGHERSHPYDTEDSRESYGSESTNSRMTAAEKALEKAMLEIEKMKAEKAEKAAKADKKKAKKAKKKDR